jgi:hypothetical protein
MRCIDRGRLRILIDMTYSSDSINRESWQQPRYESMRVLGGSLIREASG